MPSYYVIVKWDKYGDPEYITKGGFEIEAPNAHDAKQMAIQQYSDAWGFEKEFMTAFIPNEAQIEYKPQPNTI